MVIRFGPAVAIAAACSLALCTLAAAQAAAATIGGTVGNLGTGSF